MEYKAKQRELNIQLDDDIMTVIVEYSILNKSQAIIIIYNKVYSDHHAYSLSAVLEELIDAISLYSRIRSLETKEEVML